MTLTFNFKNDKAYIVRYDQEKEIPRDLLLEVYQLLLGQLCPNRDYSNVTSIKKLLKIIDLEFEPDDSDDEPVASEEVKVIEEPVTSEEVEVIEESEVEEVVKKPAPRGRAPAKRKAPVKPIPAKSETDDDDDDDE